MSDNDTEHETIARFTKRYHIAMRCKRASENPAMPDSLDMDHWRCTITCQRRRMSEDAEPRPEPT
jgi:hypothetical protein